MAEKNQYVQLALDSLKDFEEKLANTKNWENVSHKDEFKVTKYSKKDVYLIRVEKTVDATIDELDEFIHNDKNRPVWDTSTASKELLEEVPIDPGQLRVVYAVAKATPVVSTRDFVTLQHNRFVGEGANRYFIQVHVNTTHPSKPAKETVGVRAKVQVSGWKFVPDSDGKRTQLTYVSGVDIGGWLPSSIVNMALETGTCEVVQAIHRHFASK